MEWKSIKSFLNIEGVVNEDLSCGGFRKNVGLCEIYVRHSDKKEVVSFTATDNMHYYSAIASRSLVKKKRTQTHFNPMHYRVVQLIKGIMQLGY